MSFAFIRVLLINFNTLQIEHQTFNIKYEYEILVLTQRTNQQCLTNLENCY